MGGPSQQDNREGEGEGGDNMKIIRKRRWIILWVIVRLILFVGLPMAIAKAKCYEPNSLVFNHKGNLH